MHAMPVTAHPHTHALPPAAVFSEPAQDVDESHPLLLRGAHALAERYLSQPHVVKRIREVSWCSSAHCCCRHVAVAVPAQLLQRCCFHGATWSALPLAPLHSHALHLLTTDAAHATALQIRHAWQYRVPPCPQLYLYSEAGELVEACCHVCRAWPRMSGSELAR